MVGWTDEDRRANRVRETDRQWRRDAGGAAEH